MACGYELTASVAFPSLAYFQLLRFPLVMLPNVIQNCVNGLIALRRLQSFLEVRIQCRAFWLMSLLRQGETGVWQHC